MRRYTQRRLYRCISLLFCYYQFPRQWRTAPVLRTLLSTFIVKLTAIQTL